MCYCTTTLFFCILYIIHVHSKFKKEMKYDNQQQNRQGISQQHACATTTLLFLCLLCLLCLLLLLLLLLLLHLLFLHLFVGRFLRCSLFYHLLSTLWKDTMCDFWMLAEWFRALGSISIVACPWWLVLIVGGTISQSSFLILNHRYVVLLLFQISSCLVDKDVASKWIVVVAVVGYTLPLSEFAVERGDNNVVSKNLTRLTVVLHVCCLLFAVSPVVCNVKIGVARLPGVAGLQHKTKTRK